MVKLKVVLGNDSGLHLRPAETLCKKAIEYESKILLSRGETTVNAKSVLSVLGAGIKAGDELELCCDGSDEQKALKDLAELIEAGLSLEK